MSFAAPGGHGTITLMVRSFCGHVDCATAGDFKTAKAAATAAALIRSRLLITLLPWLL
jgi:hypothetical protein